MSWIYLALFAQVLSGLVILLDKFLVSSKAVSRPVVYAFYVGIMSGAVVVYFPLVSWPTFRVIELSFVIALTYIFSILFLYKSLKISDASDVAPVMGAVSALSTFLFSLWLLKDALPGNFLIGFVFLVAGMFLMSRLRFSKSSTSYVILAGILFGISSVFVKIIFRETTFWDGFFWSRMANVAGAFMLLLWPGNFTAVIKNFKESRAKTKLLVVANKALAGLAFLFVLLAIRMGDVSLVNAIGGMQFVFVLLFAFILTKKIPGHFSENVHEGNVFLHKFVSTMLIVVGFFMLFI
ncbi:MAG: hypothetical protein A2831_00195 [Candidatus Yanofskybacteria bacterium RIFCSPHIGHO2_01_FULL_44_17]|uniref:EamA domain-containing protein n=1 Tax=Candidatus Yanofskybacteria bacterium RIFCSPHIGHO2_01_FULL_44_17 TaxID=1802668 RepID=A0A1F8EX92_9BACT|nr:MAG: hypothetical protein A2831_00195 [Candidatus Yanofskybacteria bacterium RIFCSPHIGHO2_01_FULL_44_17]